MPIDNSVMPIANKQLVPGPASQACYVEKCMHTLYHYIMFANCIRKREEPETEMVEMETEFGNGKRVG